jgi:transcriptional regulator
MYIPPFYSEPGWEAAEKLISEFGFATLVSVNSTVPIATHLPLELDKNADGRWALYGHMSRANPQWKTFAAGPVLAIFLGPHAYVSPSWYNHKNVPTWNYQALHVYGAAGLMLGKALEDRLSQMMARYENQHAEHPSKYEEVPEPLLSKDLSGLVGFEIIIDSYELASKLSQNRDSESYQNIIDELKKKDEYDSKRIACEMEKRKK